MARAQQEAPTTENKATTAHDGAVDADAETTWIQLSTSNLQPPRSIMNHKLCSIKSIPREKSPNTGNYIPELLDNQHRIDQVGSLIQEAETASNHSQQ